MTDIARPEINRLRPDVALLVGVGAFVGWASLIAGLAMMTSTNDVATLGPGMAIFDRFSQFADLPEQVRASLITLCLPISARPVTAWEALTTFAMWSAMVLAMMLPSAAPVLSIGARAAPNNRHAQFLLALGYLTAWTGFAILATILQLSLAEARFMRSPMAPMTDVLAATTILVAALYQFTPLKVACLARCRNPVPMFDAETQMAGKLYVEGIMRGLDCLGCCGILMAVMFAVGTMNIIWIAGLTAIMALEKLSSGPWPSRLIGVGLLVIGLGLIAVSPAGSALLARLS